MTDQDWFVCPNCGEVLVGDPDACTRCGADDETGWSEARIYDGIDLGSDEFDYEEYLQEEFGPGTRASGRGTWVTLVILGMIAALVAMLVLR